MLYQYIIYYTTITDWNVSEVFNLIIYLSFVDQIELGTVSVYASIYVIQV